jgi:hypothetical protein
MAVFVLDTVLKAGARMVTIKVAIKGIALLGASMAIYVAAALQNGPDVADANFCKLLRRFSSAIPDQCLASVDAYGTLAATVVACAFLVLLLWDFKAPLHARYVQAIGWCRPWAKRAYAKMESHLILAGLVVGLLGMAIISYGVWRKPAAIAATTHEPIRDQQPNLSHPSMLTGRPVSGREVVIRLERLENELAEARKQIAEKDEQIAQRDSQPPSENTKSVPLIGSSTPSDQHLVKNARIDWDPQGRVSLQGRFTRRDGPITVYVSYGQSSHAGLGYQANLVVNGNLLIEPRIKIATLDHFDKDERANITIGIVTSVEGNQQVIQWGEIQQNNTKVGITWGSYFGSIVFVWRDGREESYPFGIVAQLQADNKGAAPIIIGPDVLNATLQSTGTTNATRSPTR